MSEEVKKIASPKDHCGVFAAHKFGGDPLDPGKVISGLSSLQHRGQESAGIAFPEGAGNLTSFKGKGLVSQVFPGHKFPYVKARNMIGHVRYSTAGGGDISNVQPLVANSTEGYQIALAHNGNLFDGNCRRSQLMDKGHIFHTTSDTEVLLAALFNHCHLGLKEAVHRVIGEIDGAYAAVVTDGKEVIGFRDRYGFRPLLWGKNGDICFFASESCALDTAGADIVGDVAPGEAVILSRGKVKRQAKNSLPISCPCSFCIFEFVYFARPDSVFDGENVHLVRKKIGEKMASLLHPRVDLVVPVPESGMSAALGFAEASGLPMEKAIHHNPYWKRTFIEPETGQREILARLKYSLVPSLVKGKTIGLVDDSLVRGTTARHLTSMLKKAGAREVHLFISSPPFRYPCYYGIDIPVSSQLAVHKSSGSLAGELKADSVNFARVKDLLGAVAKPGEYCHACFTGKYPLTAENCTKSART